MHAGSWWKEHTLSLAGVVLGTVSLGWQFFDYRNQRTERVSVVSRRIPDVGRALGPQNPTVWLELEIINLGERPVFVLDITPHDFFKPIENKEIPPSGYITVRTIPIKIHAWKKPAYGWQSRDIMVRTTKRVHNSNLNLDALVKGLQETKAWMESGASPNRVEIRIPPPGPAPRLDPLKRSP
jgi:hypothetical protein